MKCKDSIGVVALAIVCAWPQIVSAQGECGTAGATGHRCPNTGSANGAKLLASGTASVSNDTFGLSVSEAASSKPGLVLSGTIAPSCRGALARPAPFRVSREKPVDVGPDEEIVAPHG